MSAHLILPRKGRSGASLLLGEKPRVLINNAEPLIGVSANKLLGVLGTAVVIAILALSVYSVIHYLL